MPQILSIPFHQQIDDGYCLAACVQMVLDYLGTHTDQAKIAKQLGVKPGVGAPASRVSRLATNEISVTYESGELKTIQSFLDQQIPVIGMIQAGELPHWHGESFQHAVLIIGYNETRLWLQDPAAFPNPIIVDIDEFILAWSEMDYRYAVLTTN